MELFIPVILGTARAGRYSEKVARFVLAEATSDGRFASEILDVADFVSVAKTGEAMDKETSEVWRQTMARADGLIIVSPEYNHGYPGELKLMLDQIRPTREYQRKPAAIYGVSSGGIGGARVAEQLRTVVIDLQMVPIRHVVNFSLVEKLFDERGQIVDPSYRERLKTSFDELIWYAEALKTARAGQVS